MSSEIFIPNKQTPYFYVIQEKLSKKKYAGCRFGKGCNPIELLKEGGYHTSSAKVKDLIRRNGLESFEILEILTEDKIGDVRAYETEFLKENNVVYDDTWLNIRDGLSWAGVDMQEIIMKKYGVHNVSQIPHVRKKLKENMKIEYGGFGYGSKEIKDKIKWTLVERYGVDNPSKSKEIFDKVKERHLVRYGAWFTKTEEYKRKDLEVRNKRGGKHHTTGRRTMHNNLHNVVVPFYDQDLFVLKGYEFGRNPMLNAIPIRDVRKTFKD